MIVRCDHLISICMRCMNLFNNMCLNLELQMSLLEMIRIYAIHTNYMQ